VSQPPNRAGGRENGRTGRSPRSPVENSNLEKRKHKNRPELHRTTSSNLLRVGDSKKKKREGKKWSFSVHEERDTRLHEGIHALKPKVTRATLGPRGSQTWGEWEKVTDTISLVGRADRKKGGSRGTKHFNLHVRRRLNEGKGAERKKKKKKKKKKTHKKTKKTKKTRGGGGN